MAETWSEWIEHTGHSCPIIGQYAHMVFGVDPEGRDPFFDDGDFEPGNRRINNCECEGIARNDGSWRRAMGWYPVLRYRIRQYSALTDLKAICENPQPVREDA